MAKAPDPFYDRKPVPKELVDGIGFTGLSSTEETNSRERKFSTDKGDLRKFWNPKTKDGKLDPFYQRKPVPDTLIQDVGDTGLSKEEEFLNRERKYSVNGVDVRKFGSSSSSGWHPSDDPYYGRKMIAKPEIDGVGETYLTPAEAFENRETKTSMFDLSADPFQQLTGQGHRASISNPVGVEAVINTQRRRSSAVAPHHDHNEHHEAHHHSGYDGDNKLAPIRSRQEDAGAGTSDGIVPADTNGAHHPTTTTTTTTTTSTSTHVASSGAAGGATGGAASGETNFYHDATRGLDEVAPHERV